jgi:hypothetical protein
VVAASLLTALGACLALLAQPSAASTLESYDIHASVRYGCAQHGEDSFVEVGLKATGRDRPADGELVLQVGLAGPEPTDSTAVFPEGGPSLVTLGENPIKVRLAGPAHDGDHVFIRQVDQPESEVITLPLQKTCHRIKPTNFGLDEPGVHVEAKSCASGSQARLQVTLDNPNEVDKQLQKIGIEQIDYTVLLVRQDGLLAGPEPEGTLMSFDEPSTSVVMLRHVVTKPARYEVRVIALDGTVVTSRSIRLNCASTGNPGPSSTSRPTPSVSVTPTSSPPSSTPPPTVTQQPTSSAPTSSAPATSAPPTSAPATSAPATSAPVSSAPPAASSPAGGIPGPTASSSPSRSPRPSSSAVQPPAARPSSSPPSSSAVAVPSSSSPSPEPSVTRLVEARANYSGVPVFQRDAALVVLVFSAALAALVGATLVTARRR